MASPSSSSKVDTLDISTSRSNGLTLLSVIRDNSKNTADLEKSVNDNVQEFYTRLVEDILPLNIAFSDVIKNSVKETEDAYEVVHALSGNFQHRFTRTGLESTIDITGLVYNGVLNNMNNIPGVKCTINECSVESGLEITKFNAFVITIQKGLTLAEGEAPSNNLGAYVLQEAVKFRSQYNDAVNRLVKDYVDMLISSHFPILISHVELYPLLVKEEEDRYIFTHPMAVTTATKQSPFVIRFTKKLTEDSEPRTIGSVDGTNDVYNNVVSHFNELPGVECEITSVVEDESTVRILKIVLMK